MNGLTWLGALPGFFEDNLVSVLNGLAVGMLLFTLAIGLTLIFGLMGVLNLAHGGIYLLGGYVGFQVVAREGLSFAVAVAAGAGFGLLAGVVLAGALRPIRHRGHLDQALLTLGLAFVAADAATIFWGEEFNTIETPAFLSGTVEIFGQVYPSYRLAVTAVGAGLFVVIYLLFERTQLGAMLRASVEDRVMVSALGVNVNVVMTGSLLLGALLAGFAGVVGAPILNLTPGIDVEVLILAMMVVVIGGLGSILGAFVGAILIGEVQSLGVALIPEIAPFALFGVMALVLAVRPEGLFGTR